MRKFCCEYKIVFPLEVASFLSVPIEIGCLSDNLPSSRTVYMQLFFSTTFHVFHTCGSVSCFLTFPVVHSLLA